MDRNWRREFIAGFARNFEAWLTTVVSRVCLNILRSRTIRGEVEALISEVAYERAGVDFGDLEHRELEVRGRGEPITVHVVRASERPQSA